jgi:O-acetyl-ADP-ribose deacetylase (regulator of RNase III)
MGAFFGEYFPGEISNLPALFKGILDSSGKQPIATNQYAPGTTFILPDRFWKPAKIVVTASTIRSSQTGMNSNPYIICNCVEGILRATADERVDTIYLPILGSGHGGVDRGLALLFLLLAFLHFLKFHHHIRKVQIVVHPKDVDGLNQSKELRQIVAL